MNETAPVQKQDIDRLGALMRQLIAEVRLLRSLQFPHTVGGAAVIEQTDQGNLAASQEKPA